jgi:hypothetical protein
MVDDIAPESVLKQMANISISMIETEEIREVNFLHKPGKCLGPTRKQHKMNVIVHYAIMIYLHPAVGLIIQQKS